MADASPDASGSSPQHAAPAEQAAAQPAQPALPRAPEWEAGLALVPHSLDARLPSGMMFSSTVNRYATRVTLNGWYETFKVMTVQAVQRRLTSYEPSIIGKFNVDVQVGFRQLCHRVQALLDLHLALRKFEDGQDEATLPSLLEPLAVVRKYVVATEASLSPELEVASMMASFQSKLKSSGDIMQALAEVPVDELHRFLTSCGPQGRNPVAIAMADAPAATFAPMPPTMTMKMTRESIRAAPVARRSASASVAHLSRSCCVATSPPARTSRT